MGGAYDSARSPGRNPVFPREYFEAPISCPARSRERCIAGIDPIEPGLNRRAIGGRECKQLTPGRSDVTAARSCGRARDGTGVVTCTGGIGALAPERKHDLARLGFRAMIAGTLANFLSATLAGMLL